MKIAIISALLYCFGAYSQNAVNFNKLNDYYTSKVPTAVVEEGKPIQLTFEDGRVAEFFFLGKRVSLNNEYQQTFSSCTQKIEKATCKTTTYLYQFVYLPLWVKNPIDPHRVGKRLVYADSIFSPDDDVRYFEANISSLPADPEIVDGVVTNQKNEDDPEFYSRGWKMSCDNYSFLEENFHAPLMYSEQSDFIADFGFDVDVDAIGAYSENLFFNHHVKENYISVKSGDHIGTLPTFLPQVEFKIKDIRDDSSTGYKPKLCSVILSGQKSLDDIFALFRSDPEKISKDFLPNIKKINFDPSAGSIFDNEELIRILQGAYSSSSPGTGSFK